MSSRRWRLFGLVVSLLLAGSPALAAPRSFAVLRVEAGAGVTPEVVGGLEALVPSEVQRLRPAGRVVSGEDLARVIGLERQKQLLGCSESDCLAEVLGAMDVDELVSVRVQRLGDAFVLEVRRVDARTSALLGSANRTQRQERRLGESLRSALDDAFGGVARPPLGARQLGGLALFAGAAAAAGYGGFHVASFLQTRRNQEQAIADGGTGEGYAPALGRLQLRSGLGLATAAVLGGVGAWLWFASPPGTATTSLWVDPSGATVFVSGTF